MRPFKQPDRRGNRPMNQQRKHRPLPGAPQRITKAVTHIRLLEVNPGKLASLDERKSRAIELKFYGGMTTEEIGLVLGISVATVGRELRLAQAWLRREMSRA